MTKIFKSGRIVIVLAGRYAGRKAVVLRTADEGTGDKKFGHAVVAGISRYPRKITRTMQRTDASKAKKGESSVVAKRSVVKPFIKAVNFNHLMPTRYTLDVSDDVKKIVADDSLTTEEKRRKTKKEVRSVLEKRYQTLGVAKNEKAAQGVQYFFQRLRF